MDRTSWRVPKLAAWAFGMTVVLTALTAYLGRWWAQSVALQAALFPIAVAQVCSVMAFWHACLVRRELLEAEDQERLRRQYDRNELFSENDQSLKLAAHAHRTFDRWVQPVFTALGGALLLLLVWQAWTGWFGQAAEAAEGAVRDPLGAAGLSLFMTVFALLGGSYFNGLSREVGGRFLRPAAAWLLFAAAVFAVGVLVMLTEHFGIAAADRGAAKLVLALVAVLGAELLINDVMELFRPRTPGEEEHPLYESRLLALVTEPGGIARNVAHALDYQFGFEVSETWFYRFLERAVLPCFVLLVTVLYLMDCVVLVDAGERGVRETLGVPTADVGPGLKLKLPRPLQHVRKANVDQVRVLRIGFDKMADPATAPPPDPMEEERRGDPEARTIVWNLKHYHNETPFLVAAAEQAERSVAALQTAVPGAPSVPVNMLTCNLLVHYTVNPAEIRQYLYNYRNPGTVVKDTAYRELVTFLVSQDLVQLLGTGRQQAQVDLEQRIRAAVDALEPSTGILVQHVSLMGIHPPVDVADSFQAVVGAGESAKTTVLTAEKTAVQMRNESRGEGDALRLAARGYSYAQKTVAEGEAARFGQQLKAYSESPSVFRHRLRMDLMQRQLGKVRKFVVSTGEATRKVMVYDLKEKLRPDFEDLELKPD